MRVFVTGAGRCGSVTFAKACEAAGFVGYTCAHESHRGANPPWEYPDNHIEVDPRLTWHVPTLLKKYPEAMWVVLDRDRDAMAVSWAKRRGTMAAWRRLSSFDAPEVHAGVQSYLTFVYGALAALLDDGGHGARLWLITPVSLEEASQFFDYVEAEGDFDAFTAALREVHNAS